MSEIAKRIAELRAGVKEGVKIVLVTKTVTPEKIREAAAAGAMEFGENRVQELLEKQTALADLKIQWHMIGHLQSNKVKQVVGKVAMIQSLDRVELADEIERQAERLKVESVPCLIQVNSSGEASKFGLKPEEVEAFLAGLKTRAIRIQGLMTIGPNTDDDSQIRRAFRTVRELLPKLQKKYPKADILSMGMSSDYKIAMEEGATLIRIGTAIFGVRN